VATKPEALLSGFAVAAPGLEPWLTTELRESGLDAREDSGGATFEGTLEHVYRANLWSRLASRVVVRVSSFRVRALGELARRSATVPWEEWLAPGSAVQLRVSARKSRLYHTGAIAERVMEGMAKRVRAQASVVAGDEDEEKLGDVPLLLVRLARDVCTISLDSSGALLHRRGYRQAVAKAPMRETLAAAMLVAGEWPAGTPLNDPLCGSGTIPIEAALKARDIAPGLGRAFAFEHWPRHQAGRWQTLRDEARARIRPTAPAPIAGSDRDSGAISASRENAVRAGVAADIEFSEAPLSKAPMSGAAGWIVTNPPYGMRVGESAPLRDLYATLGRVVRDGRHHLVMLSADANLERQLGLPLRTLVSTRNGGIAVRILSGGAPNA
jgi:putative N6-adenine-specific DNA methylase